MTESFQITFDAEEAEQTSDWIAERNAKLGLKNEFDEPRAAQPDPEGFVYQRESGNVTDMVDPFYFEHVAGVK